MGCARDIFSILFIPLLSAYLYKSSTYHIYTKSINMKSKNTYIRRRTGPMLRRDSIIPPAQHHGGAPAVFPGPAQTGHPFITSTTRIPCAGGKKLALARRWMCALTANTTDMHLLFWYVGGNPGQPLSIVITSQVYTSPAMQCSMDEPSTSK
jgi:hypothetical protein